MSHPWDERVKVQYERGKQMTGLWTSWATAMRDADSMTRYYRCRVRVGKLEQPWLGRSWYVLELP